MQGTSTLRSLALVSAVLIMGGLLTSCKSTPPPPPPPPEEVFVEEVEVVEVVEEVVPEMRTVYFDFDKSNIRADARPLIKANAEIIVANPQLGTITLQGNTDERGSEEYNLGLGERRANSVKQYLVDLGVPASRLRTVSFGESKPAVMGHTESAWRWNRRVDFATAR
ncbi:peptidoglycan-associated lipoprotein Pal [Myxococcota bacterium]|nr:peptidoglycan-associated lipoprotein Pal [Myxococcota bacterium]